ncbi:MAG: hypothetical protein CVU84_15375 [Firmicutes bacterium HGW-Firmicutes-1]|jgi:hypothetical protein|nr:MAG: hypothetical protein CVU84_15375 [Firmicutes bacterium HGW-Firmicutes-1]
MRNFKKVVALVLAVALTMSTFTVAFAAESTTVTKLSDLGLLLNTTDAELGTELTREIGLTMILKSLGYTQADADAAVATSPFTDVKGWSAGWAALAFSKGITVGTSATTFAPAAKLTEKEFVAFQLRALGYDTTLAWDNAATLAVSAGLVPTGATLEATTYTKSNAAEVMYAALKATVQGVTPAVTLADQLIAKGLFTAAQAIAAGVKAEAPIAFAVESVTALNLNTVKVVFTQPVSENNAENTANYKIGTSSLGTADAAVLQADGKTVIVIMNTRLDQGKKEYFTVNAGILSKDGKATTSKVETELTFADVTIPTVASVTATGNKKVTVMFSEPVDISLSYAGLKIDGVAVTSLGASNITTNNLGSLGTTGDEATDAGYAQSLEITFGSALTAGSHTFTVPAGETGNFEDTAGFRTVETSTSFTIESVTGAPTITSVTGETNGIVYVQFNRDMESGTGINGAELTSNYKIGATNATTAAFDTGSKSKVKLTFASSTVAKGANVLTVDKDIKDAFGNSVHADDDQRVAFTAGDDAVKPLVDSVSLSSNVAGGAKITVKFSETVNGAYGTNFANYKLKDVDGNTIASSTSGIASILNSTNGVGNDDTFIITLTTGVSPLAKPSYTLEVKNIVDVAATPNKIDTVTKTITVADTVAPTVTAYETTTANKVRVKFNEAMSATMLEKANYFYVEGDGTIVALPSSVALSQIDNKTIELTFPGSLTVTPGSVADLIVAGLRIVGVRDVAGNLIAGGAADIAITTAAAATKPTIDGSTVKVQADSSKVWVTFDTSEILSVVDVAEITFGGQTPDTRLISGKTVTLNFTNTGKMDAIKLLGNTATLATVVAVANTMTAEGIPMASYFAGAALAVEENAVAPAVVSVASPSTTTVAITFSAPIDGTITGLYTNDFTVESNGALKTVSSASVASNVLTLTLSTPLTAEAIIKAIESNISIQSPATDGAETATLYVPSSTDKAGRTVAANAGVTLAATVETTPGVAATLGTAGVETITVTTKSTTDEFKTVQFTDGTITVDVLVDFEDDTAGTTDDTAADIRTAIAANAAITAVYTVGGAASAITFTQIANTGDVSIAIDDANLTTAIIGVAANTTPGVAATAGNAEVATATVTAAPTATGNIVVRLTDGTITQDVTVAVLVTDTTATTAAKIQAALTANATINAAYNVTNAGGSADVVITQRVPFSNVTITVTRQ